MTGQHASKDCDFFSAIEPFSTFSEVMDTANYHPVPDDWLVGASDVTGSTQAIAAGRYKAVNMVGASVISAVLNALDGLQFAFVFGGDGVGFAIAPEHADKVRTVMAAVQVWAIEETGLTLRTALVPVSAVREAGHDVTVARFAASPDVSYAMFSGGGMAWAEDQMKKGNFCVPPAPPGTRPDLTGLSCRWSPMRAERGQIMSLLALPVPGNDEKYGRLVTRLLDVLNGTGDAGRPIPEGGPGFSWRAPGAKLEARVPLGQDGETKSMFSLRLFALVAWFLFKTGKKMGEFDPERYRSKTRLNSDFRKFDDGLKLTIDCSAETADTISDILKKAHGEGVCYYGLHSQSEALMTCIVPSYTSDDHMHFIDGGSGGYAQASIMLKQQIRRG